MCLDIWYSLNLIIRPRFEWCKSVWKCSCYCCYYYARENEGMSVNTISWLLRCSQTLETSRKGENWNEKLEEKGKETATCGRAGKESEIEEEKAKRSREKLQLWMSQSEEIDTNYSPSPETQCHDRDGNGNNGNPHVSSRSQVQEKEAIIYLWKVQWVNAFFTSLRFGFCLSGCLTMNFYLLKSVHVSVSLSTLSLYFFFCFYNLYFLSISLQGPSTQVNAPTFREGWVTTVSP